MSDVEELKQEAQDEANKQHYQNSCVLREMMNRYDVDDSNITDCCGMWKWECNCDEKEETNE